MTSEDYTREEAKNEAIEDLKKPIEQLLTDIHEETHCETRGPMENNVIAQKRIASMMAVVATSNNKISGRVEKLAWISIIVGFIQILIAIIK